MHGSLPPLDILCKVVDNYGDIGVVYRLARALSDLEACPPLRLVVDNLEAFHALCPEVEPGLAVQKVKGWTVIDWNRPWEGYRAEPPSAVIECFACGRPDWFEDLLFDPARPELRRIVNLEYLSAEAWVDDFHALPSLTRSSLVRKAIFMPGFTAQSGGLILDQAFMEARGRFLEAGLRAGERRSLARAIGGEVAAALEAAAEDGFWVTVFSYERDYGRIVADLASFAAGRKAPLLALVANGKSSPCFHAAWEKAGRPFPVAALPFLSQETWDSVLLASDFSIVRGEDSFSRASLAGRPFLWQAYPQEANHQLVKVQAFLDRLRQHFPVAAFASVEALHLALNDRLADAPQAAGDESLLPLLNAAKDLEPGFEAFSASLVALGDLSLRLLTFLYEFV